jgi:outer membrane protein assembly factor BamE
LTGVVHFSDYNRDAVSAYLFAQIARYERDLRELAKRCGLTNEDMVDQLQPGMTKRQVQYLLGTPLLTDFFNADRWDYVYTIQRGHRSMESRRLTVFFQDDALVRIEGDMKPNPQRAITRERQDIVVTVPDYEKRKGFIGRSLEAVGVRSK